jgi:hypothetical protein
MTAATNSPPPFPSRRQLLALRVVLLGALLAAFGRFHQPGLGFTALIEFPQSNHGKELPAVRNAPHVDHPGGGGYDGQFYAQVAVDPLLRDRAIDRALDAPPYRARRILFSWTAYALGAGQPAAILRAFAVQNLICLVLLGWVLCRWFPVVEARSTWPWAACLYGYGLVASARHSLTDGPSVLLLALAVMAMETGRVWLTAATLGVAGLGRETNLLGLSILASPRLVRPPFLKLAAAATLAILPLWLWQDYLYSIYRSTAYSGAHHITTPLVASLQQWRDVVAAVWNTGGASRERFSLMVLVSLFVQLGFLAWRRDWQSPWWRLGMINALLMLVVHPAVWEGTPGAISRVVLPMTLAFNVGLPRDHPWFWPLLVAGNLSVLASLELLRVPVISAWL